MRETIWLKDGFLFIDSKPTEKDKNKLVEIFTSEYSLENGYVKFPNDSFGMILTIGSSEYTV